MSELRLLRPPMDTTLSPGHPRPVELDALRLALLVEQFGSPSPQEDGATMLPGEELVQQLDHLVSDATALTFVLIDQVAQDPDLLERRSRLTWHLRRLLPELGPRRGGSAELGRPLHRFELATWKRWDAALAALACRGLLRVDILRDASKASPSLRYTLTARGRRELANQLDGERRLQTLRERCRLLTDLVLEPLAATGEVDGERLANHLRGVAERLERFRHDEQVGPGDDLLGRFFQKTFGELP